MLNEDFNEVADQLGREVATSRKERLLYQSLINEIRGLWDALDSMGSQPLVTCDKGDCDSEDGECVEDECQKQTPPKTTKKKTTKKKGVTKK